MHEQLQWKFCSGINDTSLKKFDYLTSNFSITLTHMYIIIYTQLKYPLMTLFSFPISQYKNRLYTITGKITLEFPAEGCVQFCYLCCAFP